MALGHFRCAALVLVFVKSAFSRRPDEDLKHDIVSASYMKQDGRGLVDVSASNFSLGQADSGVLEEEAWEPEKDWDCAYMKRMRKRAKGRDPQSGPVKKFKYKCGICKEKCDAGEKKKCTLLRDYCMEAGGCQAGMKRCREKKLEGSPEQLTGCPSNSNDPEIQAMCDPVVDLDYCFDTSEESGGVKGLLPPDGMWTIGAFRYWSHGIRCNKYRSGSYKHLCAGWAYGNWSRYVYNIIPGQDAYERTKVACGAQGYCSTWKECEDCTSMSRCYQDCLEESRCQSALYQRPQSHYGRTCQMFEGLPPMTQREWWRHDWGFRKFDPKKSVVWIKGSSMTVNGVVSEGCGDGAWWQ